jgi:single-strand DNA-binding protein
MNNLKNKVNLIGRLGAKPEMRKVGEKGYSLTRFSLAVSEGIKDKTTGEWKNNTVWHAMTAWGKIAERICETLDKGVEIALEGKLVQKEYQAKDGTTRNAVEIEINDFMMIQRKTVN